MYVYAPWLDADALRNPAIRQPHLKGHREVQGGLSERVLPSYELRQRLYIPPEDLNLPDRFWNVLKWITWKH